MRQHGYRPLRWLAGCLGVTLLAAAGYSQTGADVPSGEEVANLFGKWNEALQTGKAEEVVKLYAPDAVLLPTVSNKVRHNHAEMEDYFRHFLGYQPVGKINEQNIRIAGPVAINSGVYTFTVTKGGKRSDVRARYTFVYHRRGGRWLIVEHHSSAMPEGNKGEEGGR
jgi:uncharacterized protein (TIGR02246 family)